MFNSNHSNSFAHSPLYHPTTTTSGGGGGGTCIGAQPCPSFACASSGSSMCFQWGLCELQGNRRDMEDTICYNTIRPGLTLLGVFDGHNGSAVSAFMEHNAAVHIERALREIDEDGNNVPTDLEGVLHRGVASLELEITEKLGRHAHTTGTTALLALLCDETNAVVVANVGDSRAVCNGVALTTDHTWHDPREVERVRQLGGEVECRSFRNLAVSRALGDTALKPFISCEPEVLRVCEPQSPIVLASDGVWSVLSSAEVSRFVADRLAELSAESRLALSRGQAATPRPMCTQAATSLARYTHLERGSNDNIAVVVIMPNKYQHVTNNNNASTCSFASSATASFGMSTTGGSFVSSSPNFLQSNTNNNNSVFSSSTVPPIVPPLWPPQMHRRRCSVPTNNNNNRTYLVSSASTMWNNNNNSDDDHEVNDNDNIDETTTSSDDDDDEFVADGRRRRAKGGRRARARAVRRCDTAVPLFPTQTHINKNTSSSASSSSSSSMIVCGEAELALVRQLGLRGSSGNHKTYNNNNNISLSHDDNDDALPSVVVQPRALTFGCGGGGSDDNKIDEEEKDKENRNNNNDGDDDDAGVVVLSSSRAAVKRPRCQLVGH
eukprot:PhM_4_TR419/c4_g1_i1/m.23568